MIVAPLSGRVDLKGETAIVFGGAGGIGASTVRALAREGANTVIADLMDGKELTAELSSRGHRSEYIHCNVEDPNSIKSAIQFAIKKFNKIEILIYSVGVCHTTKFEDIIYKEWQKELSINLDGAFWTLKEIIPHMVENKYGKIVCVGSIAGKIGGISAGAHYCASKGGMHAMVKHFAKNVASSGVFVNAVAPGPVQTNLIAGQSYNADGIPLGRLGEPSDVAEPIIFLSSAASNWITGTVLDINGGALMD
jgi:3-oxoacyl-[acyl-carrier protein] reductase